MHLQSPYQTFKRVQTLRTNRISALPVVILMPHSSCNCRCVMCDIWKGNKNLKQLTEADVGGLLSALKKFGTREVVMSGGEALLNPNFFELCRLLHTANLHITLLTTGITLKKNANELLQMVDEIIVSLDGPESLHDTIRNVPGAFQKLKDGIDQVRAGHPSYRITGRTVIHKLNFRYWSNIVETAHDIGLNQISFLPADVSSKAFNRPVTWDELRQKDVVIGTDELIELYETIEQLIYRYQDDFKNHFIAEAPDKIRKIYRYYLALQGLGEFPFKKCNAPWVSTVIEADGSVRPCFFHDAIGNIRDESLGDILNSKKAIEFRKTLDIQSNDTCVKCVCYLNLSPYQ